MNVALCTFFCANATFIPFLPFPVPRTVALPASRAPHNPSRTYAFSMKVPLYPIDSVESDSLPNRVTLCR